jgi:hypothetical protein
MQLTYLKMVLTAVWLRGNRLLTLRVWCSLHGMANLLHQGPDQADTILAPSTPTHPHT